MRKLWLIMYVLNHVKDGCQPRKGRGTCGSATIRIWRFFVAFSFGHRHQVTSQTKVPYSHQQIATSQYIFKAWTGEILDLMRRELKKRGARVIASSKDDYSTAPETFLKKERGGSALKMKNERERVTLSEVVKVCLRNHVQGQEQAEDADEGSFSCRLVKKLIRVSLNSITLKFFNFFSNENQIKIYSRFLYWKNIRHNRSLKPVLNR